MRGKRAAGNLVYMTSPTMIVLLFLGCYHALTSAQAKSTSTTNKKLLGWGSIVRADRGARGPLASFFIFLVISHIIFYHYFLWFLFVLLYYFDDWSINIKCCISFIGRSHLHDIEGVKSGTTANFTFIHERKISLIFCRERTYCASKQPCYCCLLPDKCFFTMEECRANCLKCDPQCPPWLYLLRACMYRSWDMDNKRIDMHLYIVLAKCHVQSGVVICKQHN